jgi:hypothetical protein
MKRTIQTKNSATNNLCLLLKDDFYPTYLFEEHEFPDNELTVMATVKPIDSVHWYNSNIRFSIIPINDYLVDRITDNPQLLKSFNKSENIHKQYIIPLLWFTETKALPQNFLSKNNFGVLNINDNSYEITYKRKLFDSNTGITKNVQNDFFAKLPKYVAPYYNHNSAYHNTLQFIELIHMGGNVNHFIFQIYAFWFKEMKQFYDKDISAQECKKIRAQYTTIAARIAHLYKDCFEQALFIPENEKTREMKVPILYELDGFMKEKLEELPKKKRLLVVNEIQLMDELFEVRLTHSNRKKSHYREDLYQLIKKHQCDLSLYFYLYEKVNLTLEGSIKKSYFY